jgi:hypothetical protein
MGKKNSKPKKNGRGKPKKQVTKEHFNRIDSAIAAVQQSEQPISKEDWVSKANRLYIKQGGSSNTKESEWAVRHTYSVLRALNLIEDKDGVIALKK